MDKQTLSNYGWVVIVTLILAVMLALATPFGTYVGDGVVSIANGFVGTSTEAIDEDNIAVNEGKWEEKMTWVTIGDINEDGHFNSNDVILVRSIINGAYKDDFVKRTAADANKDGVVNETDYTLMTNLVNGNDDTGNIGEKALVNYDIKIEK